MSRLVEVFCATQRHQKTKKQKTKKRNADKGSHGFSVYDFVDSRAQGTLQGRQYSGPDLTSVHLPIHVPAKRCSWVTTEVEQLVSTGCIARWADVADISLFTKPHMVLPLGVEPKKPRLIWDARWLN